MQGAPGPAGPPIRQHARIACHDVAAAVKIEGTEEWIQVQLGDVSLGGAFLVTDRFIVEGTQVDVGLAFPSGNRLFFTGEVVRAVSESPRSPAGLGVQFLPPTDDELLALRRELEPRMQAPPTPPTTTAAMPAAHAEAQPQPVMGTPVPSSAGAPAAGTLELTTTIYERLRLPPDCDDATLASGLERLIASVEGSLDQIPPGRQRDQAVVFKQSIERMRAICQDPIKRAAYDFNNGIVRADERIADAAAGRGPPLVKLQEAWKRIFATEVREAKRLYMEARKGAPNASEMIAQARELDPFNPMLREQPSAPPAEAQVAAAPVVAPPVAAPPVATAPVAAAPVAAPPVAAPPVAAPPVAAAPVAAPPVAAPSPFGPPGVPAMDAPEVSPSPFGAAPSAEAPAATDDDVDDLPMVDADELPMAASDDFFDALDE